MVQQHQPDEDLLSRINKDPCFLIVDVLHYYLLLLLRLQMCKSTSYIIFYIRQSHRMFNRNQRLEAILHQPSVQSSKPLSLDGQLQQYLMLIEFDKYQPNSLRRGRVQAIEKDLGDAYTIFSNRFSDPRVITMNDFLAFWNASQIKLLIFLRNQDEDEEEYFQVIDKVLISDYFLKGNDSKKIYCLLSLYFFSYSVDMNGDRNPRYIHTTPQFLHQLSEFLRRNAQNTKQLFIKVVKKIKELFVYGVKLGVREPLIKKNGETFIRYPRQAKKISRDNYSPTIYEIKQFLPGLEDTIRNYQDSKERVFRDIKDEKMNSYKKQMAFDKNITLRLHQIMKSYDSEVAYVEEDMKHIAEQPIDHE